MRLDGDGTEVRGKRAKVVGACVIGYGKFQLSGIPDLGHLVTIPVVGKSG